MKRLVVTEHTRIERYKLGETPKREGGVYLESYLYDRLKLFDRKQREEKDKVFEWNDGFLRTTQWVGVVQIPGLQIEILPKIDDPSSNALPEGDEAQYEARRNLL